jgi:hypothetical protein
VRQHGSVRGIAWHDGRLESFPLPRASTGGVGDVGVACIRALTTALLTLFEIDPNVVILCYVIPRFLVNYDLEGDRIVEDGVFRHSVQQFVRAVATEEQSNTLRPDLHAWIGVQNTERCSHGRTVDLLITTWMTKSHLLSVCWIGF